MLLTQLPNPLCHFPHLNVKEDVSEGGLKLPTRLYIKHFRSYRGGITHCYALNK